MSGSNGLKIAKKEYFVDKSVKTVTTTLNNLFPNFDWPEILSHYSFICLIPYYKF